MEEGRGVAACIQGGQGSSGFGSVLMIIVRFPRLCLLGRAGGRIMVLGLRHATEDVCVA